MAHHGMRDVILADDGDPEPGERARARGDPRRAPPGARPAVPVDPDVVPPPRRLRHRWPLAVAAVVGAVLFAVLVADVVADRRRAAHLADVPGVLEPLSPSLGVLWSEPGGWNHPAVHGPDVMVSLFEHPGGGFRLVTNDLVTGEQRWDVALPDLRYYEDLGCRAHGAHATGVSTHIICSLLQRDAPARASPRDAPTIRRTLWVFDAQTGETVGRRVLEPGPGWVESIDADVLVTTVLQDARVRVTREDLLTGQARWSVLSAPYPGGAGRSEPQVRAENGAVVLDGPFGMVVSADGEVLGEWPPPAQPLLAGPEALAVDVTALPDGRFVVGLAGSLLQAPSGTVTTADGDVHLRFDGVHLVPVVDDGSAPDLLLTASSQDGGVVAVDARTGDRLWTADVEPRGQAALLDGRLITASGSALIALDTETGGRLWSAEDGPGDHPLLTDGQVVLVPTLRSGGEPTLTALDVVDGRVRWTASAPSGVVAMYPIGGRLIALQNERMMRLGSTDAAS